MSKLRLALRVGFPSICFGLGTWQLYRLQWKQRLIKSLEEGLAQRSVPMASLPSDLESIANRRLKLYGKPATAAHGEVIFVGPRSGRDIGVDFACNLILPFILPDGAKVMLDYGRVPLGKEHQITIDREPAYLEVLLDRPEKKSWGLPSNDPSQGKWTYKNWEEMSNYLRTEPILFKRISKKLDKTSIPCAAPPKVDLSNRHFGYILTWYGIAAASLALGFLKK